MLPGNITHVRLDDTDKKKPIKHSLVELPIEKISRNVFFKINLIRKLIDPAQILNLNFEPSCWWNLEPQINWTGF